jgi:hypothetical protein
MRAQQQPDVPLASAELEHQLVRAGLVDPPDPRSRQTVREGLGDRAQLGGGDGHHAILPGGTPTAKVRLREPGRLSAQDGGLLASCGDTVLHVQCLGTEQAPYVRARNLVLADVMGTAKVFTELAEENVGATAGAFAHEGQGGVIRLGGVFPDGPDYRSVMPSTLWALAVGGERVAEDFRMRFGGYTWAEAGREDHELGAAPAGDPPRLLRPDAGPDLTMPEARRRLDRDLPEAWSGGERIRLGEGHHALRTDDATHEISLRPRPFRVTVRILTRLVGDLEPGPELVQQINAWNDTLGFAAFGWLAEERMVVCASRLPEGFLTDGRLGVLLDLHAALAREKSDHLLSTMGGRPALEIQAGT